MPDQRPPITTERRLDGSPRLPEVVRALLAVVVLLIAIFAPSLLLAPIPGVREWNRGLSIEGQVAFGVLFMAGTTIVAALLLVLLARYVDRVRLRDYGCRWDARSLPALLLGIGVSLAVVVPGTALVGALGWLRPLDAGDDLPMWVTVVRILSLAFLLQGIPEELIFRGYLLTTLRQHGPVVAVWISAVLFGVLHLVSQGGQQNALERVLYLAWPFGFGLAAGALCLVTRSVWSAVGIHAGSHLATFVCTLLGFGEGPAAWLMIGALYVIVAVATMNRFRRTSPQEAASPWTPHAEDRSSPAAVTAG